MQKTMLNFFKCITVLLVVILLVACNTGNTMDFTINSDYVININQTYDSSAVKLTVNKIYFLKLDKLNDSKFDAMQIDCDVQVLDDGIYWSPMNSEMVINRDETTVPMPMTPLESPLNKTEKLHIDLIAYVTETDIDQIEILEWKIKKAAIKENDQFEAKGLDLSMTFFIKKGE